MLLIAHPWISPLTRPELSDPNCCPVPNGSSYVQLTTKICGMSSALLLAGMRTSARLGCSPAGAILSSVFEYVYEKSACRPCANRLSTLTWRASYHDLPSPSRRLIVVIVGAIALYGRRG